MRTPDDDTILKTDVMISERSLQVSLREKFNRNILENNLRSIRRSFMRASVALTVVVQVLVSTTGASADTVSPQIRSELFTELKRYITSNTRDGKFIISNDPSQAPIGVTLKSLHPVLLKKGGTHMLCADFVSPVGRNVLIDFFVKPDAKAKGAFRVQYYVVGNRNRFFRLFERLL